MPFKEKMVHRFSVCLAENHSVCHSVALVACCVLSNGQTITGICLITSLPPSLSLAYISPCLCLPIKPCSLSLFHLSVSLVLCLFPRIPSYPSNLISVRRSHRLSLTPVVVWRGAPKMICYCSTLAEPRAGSLRAPQACADKGRDQREKGGCRGGEGKSSLSFFTQEARGFFSAVDAGTTGAAPATAAATTTVGPDKAKRCRRLSPPLPPLPPAHRRPRRIAVVTNHG